MKKNILLFCALFSVSCVSSKLMIKQENRWANIDEFSYDTASGNIYNDFWKKMNRVELRLSVNGRMNTVNIYFKDYLGLNCIEIPDGDREALLTIIDQYKSWNSIALANKEKIEKTIGIFRYFASWKLTEDWYSQSKFDDGSECDVSFFSQSATSHQLVLSFSKSYSYGNQYITKKPETIYLDYPDVIDIEKKLKLSYVKNKIDEKSKKKSIEDKYR